MSSEYVFVKYDDNYADEFDVETVWLGPLTLWEEISSKIKEHVTEGAEIYFGTNEAIEIESGEAVIKKCKVNPISAEEATIIVGWLGNGYQKLQNGVGLVNILGQLAEKAEENRIEQNKL